MLMATVPPNIEHILVWTKSPIFHADRVAESIAARVHRYGLWGFTGHDSPPPSPSLLPSCLPDLSEFGMTIDELVHPETGSEQEEMLVWRAGQEVDRFVKKRWPEREWETAWLVNPPVRLLSMKTCLHSKMAVPIAISKRPWVSAFPCLCHT